MKYNNLINQINNFYKLAGTLKYPVIMHDKIYDWVSSVYCAYIADELEEMINLGEIEGDNLRKAINFKLNLEKKMTPGMNYAVQKFKLDLSDIDYLAEDIKKHPNLLKEYITVVFLPYTDGDTIADGHSYGEFDPTNKLITIKEIILKEISSNNLNVHLSNISTTIRHELQHVTQYYTGIIKDVKWEHAGIPSIKKVPALTIKEKSKLPARLRHIEFYPHLSDTIDNLKRMFALFPKKLHKLIFDTLLGNVLVDDFINISIKEMNELNSSEEMDKDKFDNDYSYYYEKLYEDAYEYKQMELYQKDKYNKLIKELYKALGDHLS